MTKKIAIVCGSPSSEFLAPFEDKSWEIWVLGNRVNRFVERKLRFDRIFEIHDDLSEHGDINNYVGYLIQLGKPIVHGRDSFFLNTDYNTQLFPFEEVEKLYGSIYLTSSSAYMIALAIIEGATDIGIYGVDMAVDDHEYFWQRPCMEAWIGFAKGRGINVIIPEVSAIGKCDYVEGRNSGGKPEFKKPPFTETEFLNFSQKHKDKVDKFNEEIRIMESKIHAHNGAAQAYDRLAKVARAVESGINIESLEQTNVIK